jgi:hypothetical protein
MGDDPMALLGLEGALKHYYYYYYYCRALAKFVLQIAVKAVLGTVRVRDRIVVVATQHPKPRTVGRDGKAVWCA